MKCDGNSSRLDIIEFLVTRRLKTFEYLKKCLDGQALWLDAVVITPEDICRYCQGSDGAMEKRAQKWFFLGLSIAPLLDMANGPTFVSSLENIFQEWDYFFSTFVGQSWKWAMSKATWVVSGAVEISRRAMETSEPSSVQEAQPLQTLVVPSMCSPVDYYEVAYTLLEILSLVYLKFTDESSATASGYYSIVQVDAWFKDNVLSFLSKDLTAVSQRVVQQQLTSLDALFEGLKAADRGQEDDWLTVAPNSPMPQTRPPVALQDAQQPGAESVQE
uniref:Uncharacterized protein n=1 Tax=Eutreptiella gymnastica TaxID=73025 RepID=A0A7S4D2L0_9EUGL